MNKPKTPEQAMTAGYPPLRSSYLKYPTPLDENLLVEAMLLDDGRFDRLAGLLDEKCEASARKLIAGDDQWKALMYRELPVLLRGLMRRERERNELR